MLVCTVYYVNPTRWSCKKIALLYLLYYYNYHVLNMHEFFSLTIHDPERTVIRLMIVKWYLTIFRNYCNIIKNNESFFQTHTLSH